MTLMVTRYQDSNLSSMFIQPLFSFSIHIVPDSRLSDFRSLIIKKFQTLDHYFIHNLYQHNADASMNMA